MKRDERIAEAPTVFPRREFFRRAARWGVGTTTAGSALEAEHNPRVIVLQPYEGYRLQKHVEFTPNPNQQFEVRRVNFRMRRT